MKTKTLLRIVAAVAIVCLPIIAASCSKDEETGPVTYNYSWDITGFTIPNDNDSVATVWMSARSEINKLLAAAIKAKGFNNVDATAKTFNIEIDREASVTEYDDKVTIAVLETKQKPEFKVQAEKLPKAAKVVVKRSKTTVVDSALR